MLVCLQRQQTLGRKRRDVSNVWSLIVLSGVGEKTYQDPLGGPLEALWPGRERERVRPRGRVVVVEWVVEVK